MRLYLDASLLVKLYVPEPNSAKVIQYIEEQNRSLILTSHLRLEVCTAIRQQAFRRVLTTEQARQAIYDFNRDAALGYVFADHPMDWAKVYGRALKISDGWADSLGVRTLDILHVAAALELKAATFATSDERLAALAEKYDLVVKRL